MIAQLNGRLVGMTDTTALIACSDALTLEVYLPAYALEPLAAREGEHVTLYTRLTLETQTQGASFTPRLIGFPDEAGRGFFELFTSVRGLGGRKALRAMASPPETIASAIAAGDTAALKKLPEIGAKLAQVITTDLRDKVAPYLGSTSYAATAAHPAIATPAGSPAELDAIAVLVTLGQSRHDAERAIATVITKRAATPTDPTGDELVAAALSGA